MLKQNMAATGNYSMIVSHHDDGGYQGGAPPSYTPERGAPSGVNNNNYSRPGGQQNVGNFITVSVVVAAKQINSLHAAAMQQVLLCTKHEQHAGRQD